MRIIIDAWYPRSVSAYVKLKAATLPLEIKQPNPSMGMYSRLSPDEMRAFVDKWKAIAEQFNLEWDVGPKVRRALEEERPLDFDN